MGIDLGLRRVTQLLGLLGNPHKSWYSVHVAGTNGKGSVCAYLTSVLVSARIKSGRFTSPHLVNRWDAITIDGESITEHEFTTVESVVRETDAENKVGATEFELLTAVAFEIFARRKVKIAVLEVGLGGRLDATNVIEPPKSMPPSAPLVEDSTGTTHDAGVLATVITKIGLDHQSFLGDTLAKIAFEKAGIIKNSVPSIVDATNDAEVLSVVEKVAAEKNSNLIKAKAIFQSDLNIFTIDTKTWGPFNTQITPLLGNYQKSNLAGALTALDVLAKCFPKELGNRSIIESGIRNTKWPGRLEWLDINLSKVEGADKSENKVIRVLLDGAHNPQAADELADFLNTHVRQEMPDGKINFVIAFTKGKDYAQIVKRVIKSGDNVVTTEFDSIDGMPWIKSYSAQETADMVAKSVPGITVNPVNSVDKDLLQIEAIISSIKNTPVATDHKKLPIVVVFGSLYLAGKILEKYNS